MRRLRVQVQTSIDGYMGAADGAVDWAVVPWSQDLIGYADTIQEGVDCILLGRKLAEGFIPTWASAPDGEDQASIDFMNQTPRVVVSSTLPTSPWPNATIAGGDLSEIVGSLKDRQGGDIIAYGGRTLVSELLARQLVDDLYLMVNPVAIGSGLPVFRTDQRQQLMLKQARGFDCGITVLHYGRP